MNKKCPQIHFVLFVPEASFSVIHLMHKQPQSHKSGSNFSVEYTVACNVDNTSSHLAHGNELNLCGRGVFKQLIATGQFWHQTCWLAADISSSPGETPSQRGRVWNSHLLCVLARVNSIIIFEAVIMCSGVGPAGGGGGPTLLQTAGAAHHLTADSSWKVWSNPPEAGPTQCEPSGCQGQSQQTRKPLTQEERENKMEEVVETGLMKDGCFNSVLSFLPVLCNCQVFFSHLSAPLFSVMVYYQSFSNHVAIIYISWSNSYG